MKTKIIIFTALTFALLLVLTFISVGVTKMPINFEGEHTSTSELQMMLTGCVFLFIVIGLCILGLVRKNNGILLGVSIFYLVPLACTVFSYDKYRIIVGEEFVWNPYYKILIDLPIQVAVLMIYALGIIPLFILFFNIITKRKNSLLEAKIFLEI